MTEDALEFWILASILLPIVVAVVGLSFGRRISRGHFLWYLLPGFVNAILFQAGDRLGIPVLSSISSVLDSTAGVSVLGAVYVVGITMPIVFARDYRIVATAVSVVMIMLSYASFNEVM